MSKKPNLPLWMGIYEFLDEIIGSIVPGAFFTTYFMLCAMFMVYPKTISTIFDVDFQLVFLPFLAIAYVMGTVFRRGNLGEPDRRSAKYIYFHSSPSDDNSYAFVIPMKRDEYLRLVNAVCNLNRNIGKKIICERYIKTRRKLLYFVPAKIYDIQRLEPIPLILKKIYRRLQKMKRKIGNKNIADKQSLLDEINNLINTIEPYINFTVDYPYKHLQRYLEDRGMKQLTRYVNWDGKESGLTARSKSFSCGLKVEMNKRIPEQMNYIIKNEAHVRFMNSLWHSSKFLSVITLMTSILSLMLIFLKFTISNFLWLYNYLEDIGIANTALVQRIDLYIEAIVPRNNLFIIFVLSSVFFVFTLLIKRAIYNNFHYQRIREIVYMLQTYDSFDNIQKKQKPLSLSGMELNYESVNFQKK